MRNSEHKNAVEARVFNNLKRNFPEQPREAESIAVRENCRSLAAERQSNNEMDDTIVDNDISAFNDAIFSYDSSLIIC